MFSEKVIKFLKKKSYIVEFDGYVWAFCELEQYLSVRIVLVENTLADLNSAIERWLDENAK